MSASTVGGKPFGHARNLEVRALRENLTPVLTLAIPGLLISTAVIGSVMVFAAGLGWPEIRSYRVKELLAARMTQTGKLDPADRVDIEAATPDRDIPGTEPPVGPTNPFRHGRRRRIP